MGKQKKKPSTLTPEELAEKKRIEQENLCWASKWGIIWGLTLSSLIPVAHFLFDQHFIQGGIERQWILIALMAIVVVLGLIVVFKTRKET